MAKDKKSFIAYCDWVETFDELTDEEAGKLAKHLFRYVNDQDPEAPDRLTKMLFIDLRRALKRDLKKYEGYIEKQRENGAKGGRPRKTQITQPLIEKPKKADSVSVSVSVTDTVNDNVNGKEIRELKFREQVAKHSYPDNLKLDFCDYWTESKPNGKKLRFEMQQTFDISRRLKKWQSNNFGSQKETGLDTNQIDYSQVDYTK